MATTKAVVSLTKQQKNHTSIVETIILELSTKLSKFIKLNEYKKSKLKNSLRSAEIFLTPENYVATAYVKVTLVIMLGVIFIPILPFLFAITFMLDIAIFFKERNKADEIMKTKRESIECELDHSQ